MMVSAEHGTYVIDAQAHLERRLLPSGWPLAAAAIMAGVGSLAGGAAQAGSAFGSKGGGKTRVEKFPAPPEQEALQRGVARLFAANLGLRPATFGEYIESDGRTRYLTPQGDALESFLHPGMTPTEAIQLGMLGPQGRVQELFQPEDLVSAAGGGKAPDISPGAQMFTPEQQLLRGFIQRLKRRRREARGVETGPRSMAEQLFGATKRRERFEAMLEKPDLSPRRTKRITKLVERAKARQGTALEQFGYEPTALDEYEWPTQYGGLRTEIGGPTPAGVSNKVKAWLIEQLLQ